MVVTDPLPADPARRVRVPTALRRLPDRLAAVPPRATLTAALALTTGLWMVLQRAEPYLGHDESVYAGRARSLLTGTPAAGWMAYRPVGLPELGRVGLWLGRPLGNDTLVVRLIGLGLALVTLGIVFAVGSRIGTPRRAAVAVLVVLSGATFLRRLPEFLDDIPAAGMLLLTAYLVLRSRRPGRGWALPAAGATGMIALLLRYGAAAGLLSIAGAAVLVWGPGVWLRAWRQLVGVAATSLLGLVPFALYSLRETGSVLGVLVRAEVSAHRDYLGQGLGYYAQAYPAKLAGVVGAVAMTLALVAMVRTAGRLLRVGRPGGPPDPAGAVRPVTPGERERLFLAVAAVGNLLQLGLLVHGESRFALFTVLTLVVLGVDALAEAAGGRRRTVLATTGAAAVLSTMVTAALLFTQISGATAQVRAVASVAERLRGSVSTTARIPPGSGSSCLVVTRLSIEASWASGCTSAEPGSRDRIPADATVYVVTFPRSPGWSSGPRPFRMPADDRSWTLVPVPAPGPLGTALVSVSGPVRPLPLP